ncbi:TraR/DksA C4-type zinc finger protein [Acinetobacter chinensis]|jgi:phage/conjugal plasmid C-4 type zinc finger TraR family protein|uniref:TraR/DksA C4-type zinc finger protein n=1 Tax=Acinetobacter chinensis TaxID=2004650 RepID=UPI0029351F1C|nr:TraR/DksA C4-type zinc finger protein [Acinetobacter chinensis]WOE42915.1 TraR/DksA C4-type zinc finger protein [Acinetobacter chinensis]
MVDLVDMAEEFRARQMQESINARQQFGTASELDCDDCGEEIPQIRRELGGVTRCIQCQTNFEAKQKHFK